MFLVCGEALFDFFLETDDGPGAARYAARAGGSPFNVALGLARLDQAAGLLTGLSRDLLGQRLRRMLEIEGVSTAFAIPTERPTTISLVGLDADGVPAYQFYGAGLGRHRGGDRRPAAARPRRRRPAFRLLLDRRAAGGRRLRRPRRARAGRFISLDPNVRPTVEPDMAVWRARVDALMPHVDVVKISAEDIAILTPGRSRRRASPPT
jgi:fructokinase